MSIDCCSSAYPIVYTLLKTVNTVGIGYNGPEFGWIGQKMSDILVTTEKSSRLLFEAKKKYKIIILANVEDSATLLKSHGFRMVQKVSGCHLGMVSGVC